MYLFIFFISFRLYDVKPKGFSRTIYCTSFIYFYFFSLLCEYVYIYLFIILFFPSSPGFRFMQTWDMRVTFMPSFHEMKEKNPQIR